MQDRAEIAELVVRYVTALDTLDPDTYAEVFTEDVIVKRQGRWQILSRKLVSFVR